MSHFLTVCGALALLVTATAPRAQALPVSAQEIAAGHALGHVMVRFLDEDHGGPSRSRPQSARTLGLPAGAELMETGYMAWLRRTHPTRYRVKPDLGRALRCRVPKGMSAEQLVEALNRNPLVAYAELDFIGQGGEIIPSDTSFATQWYHQNSYTQGQVHADIRSTEAWDITCGSSNVVVAVLDTGLNLTSPEFAGRVVPGYDFVNNDTDPTDDHDHGTMVTGMIAANANNTNLIAGVDWHCRIMPLKILDSSNYGSYSDWTDAIDWAVTNGAKVINLSAGGSTSSTGMSNAIMNAIAQGVIFVTITHNDGSGSIRFPGRMQSCITLGATTSVDERWSGSNYGSALDLVAPGSGICSLNSGGGLQCGWNGTSFAAPLAAGVAALLAGLYPDITQDEVNALLCAGADDQVGKVTEDTPGFDIYHGWGRLNARATLELAMTRGQPAAPAGGNPGVTWASPLNASNKQPYTIDFADSPTSTWTRIEWPANLAYSPTNTTWSDDGSETGTSPHDEAKRYYRVGVAGPR